MTKLISRAALAAAAIIIGVFGASALLVTAAVPVIAADNVASSHTVQFDKVSFTCGEAKESGKVVRFIHATPEAKYLPEYEPAATDPLAKSWDIIYRNICERDGNMTAGLSDKHR